MSKSYFKEIREPSAFVLVFALTTAVQHNWSGVFFIRNGFIDVVSSRLPPRGCFYSKPHAEFEPTTREFA